MLKIGLTGTIGSGKSAVADILLEQNIPVIDADKLTRKIYAADTDVKKRLAELFGQDIIAPNGEVDRKALGKLVFNDSNLLKKLERLVWPAIEKYIKAEVEQFQKQGVEKVTIEAALLLRADWENYIDVVWIIDAPPGHVKARLLQKGYTSEQVGKIVSSQPGLDENLNLALVKHKPVSVIKNDGNQHELKNSVIKVLNGLHTR